MRSAVAPESRRAQASASSVITLAMVLVPIICANGLAFSNQGGTASCFFLAGSPDLLGLKQKCVVAFGLEVESGLLSLIKVYLCFLLDSKFDKVIIGRSLICSLAIDHMGHPGPQLRVHALKEAID